MPKTKKAIQNSTTVTVVYFGSEDLCDRITVDDFVNLKKKLAHHTASTIRSVPMVLLGLKIVKLAPEVVVLKDTETFSFAVRETRKINGPIETDAVLEKAAEMLESAILDTGAKFVLVPFYAKVVKKSQ